VLGGGQLARMLALAGHPLGVSLAVVDPAPDACAAAVAHHIRAAYDDPAALDALAARADVVTFEFENVPAAAAEQLAARVAVHPAPAALRVASDRAAEKALFRRLGMATAEYAVVDSLADLEQAVDRVGLPAILKTRSSGYDGKGQVLLRERHAVAQAWQQIGGQPAILEALVPFERELSIIAVRGRNGETRCYPLSENTHRAGILRLAIARPGHPRQRVADEMAARLLDELDYVGVLAIELFEVGGRLLANEFAPRVHNSGHWTLHGAEVSQFENHLRAVLGLPLGSTALVGAAAMVNFIGRMPDVARLLALPDVHLETYGKAPRTGRKLGHATVRSSDPGECERRARALLELAEATADG
jgi:5-(carboxyamino)imidazole ribonucleotide synthase